MLTLWLAACDDAAAPSQPGLTIKTAGTRLRTVNYAPVGGLDGVEILQVPAGMALAPDLMEAVRASGLPALVTINGVGDGVVREVLVRGGIHVILLFDTDDMTAADVAEQLAWLRSRGRPFAVAVAEPELAGMAILAGAGVLLVQGRHSEVIHAASRLVAVSRAQAPRPLSIQEIDALDGREMCLTVNAPLSAGEVLTADHLATALTPTRGLSPRLSARVIGLKLAYAIDPGEPLHFAHFGDPKA